MGPFLFLSDFDFYNSVFNLKNKIKLQLFKIRDVHSFFFHK